MRVVAIIQAHMASTRLPGKVLLDIQGAPMIERVVCRARRARIVDEVVVACADAQQDDELAAVCANFGAPVFRGSDADVLSRYVGAAQRFRADVVVRITSDNPLIDPEIIGKVFEQFRSTDCDYASNSVHHTYPVGLDAEVMKISALMQADVEAKQAFQRVHVTPYLYQNPSRFHCISVLNDIDLSRHRWTVDTPEDLEFVRAVYGRFAGRDEFSWRDVLALIEREPQLLEINRGIRQKALHEG